MEHLSLIATCIDIFSLIPQYRHIKKNGITDEGYSKTAVCVGVLSSTLWIVNALRNKNIMYVFAATFGLAFQLFILSKVLAKDRHTATVKSNT